MLWRQWYSQNGPIQQTWDHRTNPDPEYFDLRVCYLLYCVFPQKRSQLEKSRDQVYHALDTILRRKKLEQLIFKNVTKFTFKFLFCTFRVDRSLTCIIFTCKCTVLFLLLGFCSNQGARMCWLLNWTSNFVIFLITIDSECEQYYCILVTHRRKI